MKYTLLTVLTLLSSVAFGQTKLDTVLQISNTNIDNLTLKLRKASVQTVKMGLAGALVPDTDVQGGNAYNSLAKILTYQLPLSVNVSQNRLDSISDFIKNITEPISQPPVPPVTEKIDGEKAAFSIAPNPVWTNHSPNANWSGGTIAFSNAPGSTATYTFTGTKIELWAERLLSHGTGTIKIDTGAEVPVSFKTLPLGLPVKIYESSTLPLGTHTITLKCVSGYVLLDYFMVQK